MLRQQTTMTLKWIAQRLHTGSWTYVSNLLHQNQPHNVNSDDARCLRSVRLPPVSSLQRKTAVINRGSKLTLNHQRIPDLVATFIYDRRLSSVFFKPNLVLSHKNG